MHRKKLTELPLGFGVGPDFMLIIAYSIKESRVIDGSVCAGICYIALFAAAPPILLSVSVLFNKPGLFPVKRAFHALFFL